MAHQIKLGVFELIRTYVTGREWADWGRKGPGRELAEYPAISGTIEYCYQSCDPHNRDILAAETRGQGYFTSARQLTCQDNFAEGNFAEEEWSLTLSK